MEMFSEARIEQMRRDLNRMNAAEYRYVFSSMENIKQNMENFGIYPNLSKINGSWFATSEHSIDGNVPESLKAFSDTKLIAVLRMRNMSSPSIAETRTYQRGFDPEPWPVSSDYLDVFEEALENATNAKSLNLDTIKTRVDTIGLSEEYMPEEIENDFEMDIAR